MAVVLAMGVLSCPAASPDHSIDPPTGVEWLQAVSPHFTLYTTASEPEARALLNRLETVRLVLRAAFQQVGAVEKPVRVIAFRSAEEMKPYAPTATAAGFYLPGRSHDFIVLASPSPASRAVAHEYAHAVLSQNGVELGGCLDEGFAEVYADFSADGSGFLAGQFIDGRVATIARVGWRPLSEFLDGTYQSDKFSDPAYRQSIYAECWLLAHMMLFDAAYQARLADFFAAVEHAAHPSQALLAAYFKDVGELDRDTRQHLETGRDNSRFIEVQADPSAERLEISAHAGLAARLALAEMLAGYSGRAGDARAAYEQLERQYPESAAVELGLADWYTLQGQESRAAEYKTRAAQILAAQ